MSFGTAEAPERSILHVHPVQHTPMLSSLVTVAFMLLAPLAVAFAPPTTYDLALPAHITVAERAHKSTVVPVLVQLEPRNSASLFELALAVSTPFGAIGSSAGGATGSAASGAFY